jgi:FMN phosphatase YigB (HAD superfamily)
MPLPPLTLLFELRGVLADPTREQACAPLAQARYLAVHFGGAVEAWLTAGQRIEADWDSYYADLDLGGEQGYHDWLEGEFRTLRARFRLAGIAEPTTERLWSLTREIAQVGGAGCNSLYAEVAPVVDQLRARGYRLGLASNWRLSRCEGLLEAGGLLAAFDGPRFTVDTVEQFLKDETFYRRLALPPAATLIVDADPRALDAARQVGFQTALVWRSPAPPPASPHGVLGPDLRALLAGLGPLSPSGNPHSG